MIVSRTMGQFSSIVDLFYTALSLTLVGSGISVTGGRNSLGDGKEVAKRFTQVIDIDRRYNWRKITILEI